jgi:2-(3-amino-3-carboxypropyl)histidine synthase
MKILHIHAKAQKDIVQVLKKVKLSGKIGLASSIQYLHKLPEAQKLIKNSIIAGQILGCDASKAKAIASQVDCFLFIGSGIFHPVRIAIETNKQVYLANPETNEFGMLPQKDIDDMRKSIRGKLSKLYSAEKIGILVSTKPGQHNMKKAFDIRNMFPEKESFIFIFNTLNDSEFENFRDIEFWVNTACNRIAGKNIINAEDIKIEERIVAI